RLSHAGLAQQHHHPAPPTASAVDQPGQHLTLAAPPKHHHRKRDAGRLAATVAQHRNRAHLQAPNRAHSLLAVRTRAGRRPGQPEHIAYAALFLALDETYEMLSAMGVNAFAERTRRELIATGEKIAKRKRTASWSLTSPELPIARLVQQGLSNPEIGSRLFLSPRTIEWHLRNIYGKVGASSRRQLRDPDLTAPVE